jgi:hypothetical protein
MTCYVSSHDDAFRLSFSPYISYYIRLLCITVCITTIYHTMCIMLVRALDVLHVCAIIGAELGRVSGRQVSEAMPLQLGRVSAQVGRGTCSRRALDVLHACSTRSRREGSREGMRSHALQEAAEKVCSTRSSREGMLSHAPHVHPYIYMCIHDSGRHGWWHH